MTAQPEEGKNDPGTGTVVQEPLQIRRWLIVILLGSLLFICYSTLYPFDFFYHVGGSFSDRFSSFSVNLNDFRDFPENVLLFVPLGFGLAGLFGIQGFSRAKIVMLTLVGGVGLSLVIEVAQMYSTVRIPTIMDTIANGLGAFLGWWLSRAWGEKALHYGIVVSSRLRSRLPRGYLIVAAAGYFALMLVLSLFLIRLTSLANWDPAYRLLLGNEWTNNRAWRGTLSQVYLADRVLSEAEIARLFAGEGPTAVANDSLLIYQDFTDDDLSDNFPAMIWHGEPSFAEGGRGAVFARMHWLYSRHPVTELSQTLAAKSQFTLGATIAPHALDQRGPARIISISEDLVQRNLMLGQMEKDLVLRVRTPLTGDNGIYPELIIPDFFTDTEMRQVVITYDGTTARFYLENPPKVHQIELSPPFVLFSYYPGVPITRLRLHTGNMVLLSILYDALVFVPLSLAFAFQLRRSSWSRIGQAVAAILVITLTTLIWEGLLSLLIDSYALRPDRLFLATIVAVTASLIFIGWTRA